MTFENNSVEGIRVSCGRGKWVSLSRNGQARASCRSPANGVVILKYRDRISPRRPNQRICRSESNLIYAEGVLSSFSGESCLSRSFFPSTWSFPRRSLVSKSCKDYNGGWDKGGGRTKGSGERSTRGQLAFWKHLNSYTRINSKNFTRNKI